MKVISIDKETVNRMPVMAFDKPIYVIDKISQVLAAVAALRRYPVLGFDTETRPTFHRGERHSMALVQLSTPDEAFLFRTCVIGLPDALLRLLQSRRVKKVGLSVHDDIHGLTRLNEAFRPGGFIDVQHLIVPYGITDLGLQKIYAILFGKKISKSQQLTNWEAKVLSEPQQRYAALDAYSCLQIYDLLTAGAFDPAHCPYLHDAPSPSQQ